MATDDLTLVQRARTGDQRAFKLLVERYQRKVYAVAYGMLKNSEEAKDATQDAFIKVYKYLPHFKGDASFYTWLYRVTSNVCIDVIRRRGIAKHEPLEYDDGYQGDDIETKLGALGQNVGTSPQKGMLNRELAQKIQEALEQVPVKHREILLLREVDGMSYEDLSRTLNIPKGTVMSRLFHARMKMQGVLSSYLSNADMKPLATEETAKQVEGAQGEKPGSES